MSSNDHLHHNFEYILFTEWVLAMIKIHWIWMSTRSFFFLSFPRSRCNFNFCSEMRYLWITIWCSIAYILLMWFVNNVHFNEIRYLSKFNYTQIGSNQSFCRTIIIMHALYCVICERNKNSTSKKNGEWTFISFVQLNCLRFNLVKCFTRFIILVAVVLVGSGSLILISLSACLIRYLVDINFLSHLFLIISNSWLAVNLKYFIWRMCV